MVWSSKKARLEDSITSNLATPSTHSDPRDTHETAHHVLARRHPFQEVPGSFPYVNFDCPMRPRRVTDTRLTRTTVKPMWPFFAAGT